MSVPYPGNRPGSRPNPRSQREDQLSSLATRYIVQNLDGSLCWDDVTQHLQVHHGKDARDASDGALMAVLDLEWDDTIRYYGTDSRIRRHAVGDPEYVALPDVAAAVLDLGWPPPVGRSRKIYQCFLELGSRYRHCDVYWAMHEVLKGSRLRCFRAYWSLLGDTEILADPNLTVAERIDLERKIEADLCDEYEATLDHPVVREYPLGSRRADIFDRNRRLIVEAKATTDDVVVLGAITQAMLYRTIINGDSDVVDHIAVLLPHEPTPLARQVVRLHELEAVLIWRDGDTFRHESFGYGVPVDL